MTSNIFITNKVGYNNESLMGEVTVTKVNPMSFKYRGIVTKSGEDEMVRVEGLAKFWKESNNGTQLYFKHGKATLTFTK